MALRDTLIRFASSVRADFGSMQRYREKYHKEKITPLRMPVDAVRKIGFQMLVATRTMRLLRDARIPLGPQVASRLIRHLYGAEIHWDSEIADGVSIVHGNGLVLSHGATIGPGCILFHNVTLGEGLDPRPKRAALRRWGATCTSAPGRR
jgi:serine acetyltransferase